MARWRLRRGRVVRGKRAAEAQVTGHASSSVARDDGDFGGGVSKSIAYNVANTDTPPGVFDIGRHMNI